MTTRIKFCGAAGTVTGSCYRLQVAGRQFLVDCGMFQGTKTLKELNYGPFPFDPAEIDFVLLTHAHIDHSGVIPKLIKAGFTGPVYTTAQTRDLLSYMLPDSGYIQEVEVERLNRRNQQRGKAAVEPIYTRKDAEQSIAQIHPVEFEEWLQPCAEVKAKFWNAGHILGAASIEIEITERDETLRLLFSGDIGPDNKLFHSDPEAPGGFDYVVCESTYGGRFREDATSEARREILSAEINEAMKAGGALIIPSFAVERTQELLLDIDDLLDNGQIACSAVFLDSPLAIRVTSVFSKYKNDLEDVKKGDHPFSNPKFHFTETVEESKSIARFDGGVIIVAASGMCDAGRVRHHLKNHLWRPKSTVLLVGYQAAGTLGRLLQQGLKKVRIQGEEIKVRAHIRSIDTYSGHADGNGLVAWVEARKPVRQAIFLTHGSQESLQAMQAQLLEKGFEEGKVITPALDEEYELRTSGKTGRLRGVSKRLAMDSVDKLDWHNELAQLTLDIRSELESTPDTKQKSKLLSRLRRALKK
ncbi:MBL fold metallo-hydrolase RNA specificity domain-containing protein [Sneathiella sp. HT1-7]|uniref:MBL fold metallo-hydrolase RNA specificity domain-containing protein n=1 Tax=Sneathiella sp. HT1-7 TaxID=2887192 RepID=UPI001D136533|nr:MBL fold metallo-hydrolase [Sneathiella sp. HT1-7]MCC3305112.1 MBL fold metallo-hydrolase [Sneathiella sp. HT1-7]